MGSYKESLYKWHENYCEKCRRYVERDEFEYDVKEQKWVGVCKVCGKQIDIKVVYDKL